VNERRASLEKGDANADPVEIRGRQAGRVKRAKRAARPFAGVVATAWVRQEYCDNTGNPSRWETVIPTGDPRGTGWAVKGGGEARSSDEAG